MLERAKSIGARAPTLALGPLLALSDGGGLRVVGSPGIAPGYGVLEALLILDRSRSVNSGASPRISLPIRIGLGAFEKGVLGPS